MAEHVAAAPGGPAAQRLPAYKRERRRRIVEAAEAALERQEFEQVRISDVAQGAGVALGTLYRYFSSKEHLYAVTLQEWLHRSRVGRPLPGERAEDRVRARVHTVIAAFQRRPRFFKLNVLLYGSTESEVNAILAEIAASAQSLLAREFTVLGEQRAQDTATMLWAVIYAQLTTATYHDGTFAEAHRIADGFVDLLADPLRRAERA